MGAQLPALLAYDEKVIAQLLDSRRGHSEAVSS